MELINSPLIYLNILLVAFYSYLYRWQRTALIFSRSLPGFERANRYSHMLLVPAWQRFIYWPLLIGKWFAWAILWFYTPWYVPIGFIVLSLILVMINRITISPIGHHGYFVEKTYKGTQTSPDGTKYHGEFKDGKPNGRWSFTTPDGTTFCGRVGDAPPPNS